MMEVGEGASAGGSEEQREESSRKRQSSGSRYRKGTSPAHDRREFFSHSLFLPPRLEWNRNKRSLVTAIRRPSISPSGGNMTESNLDVTVRTRSPAVRRSSTALPRPDQPLSDTGDQQGRGDSVNLRRSGEEGGGERAAATLTSGLSSL
ncbi:hypothetical protein AAFF_G00057030 [Aldrovandia affinis]|uniref:Uncharacterized protein n=1 Tax=Aldrovandia affinis TaxID=143900 RepID=A0AAD7S0M3_9TELE|nr:hypothetical protein AAFF_G00057030 [Aldrovandia affinis]